MSYDLSSLTSGLASGLDWTSIVSSLVAIKNKSITLLEDKQTDLKTENSAWSQVTSYLAALESSIADLSDADDFDAFTSSLSVTGSSTDAEDLLSVAVGSAASEGSYTFTIDSLATAQKLSSAGYTSKSTALGISGSLLINGQILDIDTSDSLVDLKSAINSLNSGDDATGVTATITATSSGAYRLLLTADETGEEGMDLANASGTDLLTELGFSETSTTLSNAVTNGALSSNLDSSTGSIKSLLGLSTAESGTVTIAGVEIDIDLATDSLQSIRDTINNNTELQALGVSAAVVSSTDDDGVTTYALQIKGTQDLEDSENILQTLGFLRQGHADVTGVTGATANTTGGAKITASTLLGKIDGYATWTSGDTIAITGKAHDGVTDISGTFTITEDSTVNDLLTAIEAAYGNTVSASVNADGKIVVEDNQGGTSSLTMGLTATLGDTNSTLSFGTFSSSTIRKREIVAGADAQITLDGETVTRASNTISDLIEGVTLKLTGADEDAEITINVERDTDTIETNIETLVSAYNKLMTYISDQSTYDSSADEQATLYGDSTLRSIKTTLRSIMTSTLSGLSEDVDRLGDIGITLDDDGQLQIDSDTLEEYLTSNFDDIVNLFTAHGSSSSGDLTYVNSGDTTAAGTYEVEITQVATQATATGSGFSTTGVLSGNQTLTVTDTAGNVATISLTNGWDITSIVGAVNSELSKSYNQILVGENAFFTDSGQASTITENTTLDSIYNDAGSAAGLTLGDVISFSGTDRHGDTISGSYTIGDTGTETVSDVLATIEDAYGDGYDAYIDDSGRIAIKDTTTGNSRLTLSVSSAKLDFGTIDVDATGSDGSQTGRSAVEITAVDKDGELKLYNNTYGNDSFTVAVSGGNLGLSAGTYTGTDVAGRIRKQGSSEWMTMTGNGQALTGDNDQTVDGLVIKYAGTTTGAYDFTLTNGIGAQLEQAISSMTDSVDGYVTQKQESLTNQADKLDDKIATAQDRITTYQDMLIKKFLAMETTISTLNSTQSWLESQIKTL